VEVIVPDEHETSPLSEFQYTAFEKWKYRPIIYSQDLTRPWIDYRESFYRASELLIDDLAKGRGFQDIEGVAAVFLFRHYLELALKRIILEGRYLISPEQNAASNEVERVENEHKLAVLWRWVLEDAKPKIAVETWNSYDVSFVENCITEFHDRDQKGFAFRYPGQGGERYEYDFQFFRLAMQHVYQILKNMEVYLTETYAQNAEWQAILRAEAGY
jgi:hypothetical protein